MIRQNEKIGLFVEEDEVGVFQRFKEFRRLEDFRKSRVIRHQCIRDWFEEKKNISFVLLYEIKI